MVTAMKGGKEKRPTNFIVDYTTTHTNSLLQTIAVSEPSNKHKCIDDTRD
jgi:hypothetical protein